MLKKNFLQHYKK